MSKEVAIVIFNGKNTYGFRIGGNASGKNVGSLEAPHTPLIPGETDKQACQRRLEELRLGDTATVGKQIEEIKSARFNYYRVKLKAGTRITSVEHQSILEETPASIVTKDWIPEQSELVEWYKTQ